MYVLGQNFVLLPGRGVGGEDLPELDFRCSTPSLFHLFLMMECSLFTVTGACCFTKAQDTPYSLLPFAGLGLQTCMTTPRCLHVIWRFQLGWFQFLSSPDTYAGPPQPKVFLRKAMVPNWGRSNALTSEALLNILQRKTKDFSSLKCHQWQS